MKLYQLLIYVFILSVCTVSLAEDGMCLVTCGTSFGGDYLVGNIRRIDMRNGQVVNTTGNLGYGTFPRFSPDGTKFAFINGNTVTIASIDGGVVKTFTVAGNGNLSWTKSGIWICTNNQFYKYDLNGNFVLQKSFQYCERGVVSQNEVTGGGTWTAEWCPVIYSMGRGTSLRVPKRDPSQAVAGCSVCPNPSGTMITNNMNNPAHRAMRIVDTLAQEKYYLLLSTITGLGTDYYWLEQNWSGNSDQWIVLNIGKATSTTNPQLDISKEPWIYNIVTHEVHRLATRTNDFWQPFDYYSGYCPGSSAPTLQLSPAILNFAADSGSTNPPTQTVTASTPNGTLQGLAVSGAKSWLTVTPGAASGASIAIVNSASLTVMRTGTYLDTITVSTTNAGSKQYTVSFTVRRPTGTGVLTSLTVSPPQYTVAAGSSTSFLATCKDQNGNYFSGASLSWTASGGGTITQTGIFTAASAPSHGAHRITITATAGGITLRDTAWIMVSRKECVHKKIDAGTNSYCPTGWEIDDPYVSGGSDINNAATVTVSGVPAAAPVTVYTSARRGSPHSYSIRGGLTQGPYTVRMHFADPKDTVRYMSYSIRGVNVLRDFRISSLAGGANKALVLDFTTQVQDTNGIDIACSAANNSDVFESGFEIMQQLLTPIVLLSPIGGERVSTGDTLKVRWCTDTLQVFQIYVELSVNNGVTFGTIVGPTGILRSENPSGWGTFNWRIPDSIDINGTLVSVISNRCRVRISNYFSTGLNAISDSMFTIYSRAPVTHIVADPELIIPRCSIVHNRLYVQAPMGKHFRLDISSVAGKRLCSLKGIGPCSFPIPKSLAGKTVLVRLICGEKGRWEKIIVVGY
jgi:hypothetical protein